MQTDEKYMWRALTLARNGVLDASPNPMVGAVIVDRSGRIIGEGWHRRCGEGHAEVNAIASVADQELLKDATMYVTLEPCSHYGKTPPCADLIVEKCIPRVVVGTLDPFSKVSGRGVERMRKAGVEVKVGMLEKECCDLNIKFMTAHRQRRPYITLKWAQSSDGFIDGQISTPLTSVLVHRLRATHDAILIGSGTALADNPGLDTRLYAGRSPLKVVLDRRGRLSSRDLRLFADGHVMVFNDYTTLSGVMSDLYEKGITSVLVEGGADVLKSFLDENLWDEIRVEVSPSELDGKVKAPNLPESNIVPNIETVDGHRIVRFVK